MLLELIATLCTGLFTGAAIYVNLVEHPARLEPGTAAAAHPFDAAGRSQVGGNSVPPRAPFFVCRSPTLRPQASRPQLKRDPLGGTSPHLTWPCRAGVTHRRRLQ